MASNLDREVLSARMCINLIFTRVSGIFGSSTSSLVQKAFQPLEGLENV
jgi:hypothetical protein